MNSPLKPLVANQSVVVPVKQNPTDPRPIFLAMQGGGAKGVAHVGALSAIEKFQYEIRGVSGTSAGSMVAALVSSGYKAEELVNLETKEHLFSGGAEGLGFNQPIDIFPGSGWRNLKFCQFVGRCLGFGPKHPNKRTQGPVVESEPEISLVEAQKRDLHKLDVNRLERQKLQDDLVAASAKRCAKKALPITRFGKVVAGGAYALKAALVWLGLSVRVSANIAWFVVYYFTPFTIIALTTGIAIQNAPLLTTLGVSGILLILYLTLRKIFSVAWRLVGGLNTVGNVSLLIDRLVSRKLAERGYPNNGGITFADLKKARASFPTIPLKIVATNVAHECLELFCEDRTPDVKIGDAVAASVCLPFVFKPWNLTFYRHTETRIELIEGQFLDGGLVSNLPAWPFDEERVLNPEIGTIALSIESEVKIGKHWTAAVLGTVVNGSSMIHTRAAGSTLKIPLAPRLEMMQFDASAQDVLDVVSATAIAVDFRLAEELRTRSALEASAKALHTIFHTLVTGSIGQWFQRVPNPRVRVAIVAERGGSVNSLSTVFTHGYKEGDVDRTATRRADCWIFDKALKTGKARLYLLNNRVPGDDMYRGERVWPKARWLACFPIPLPQQLLEMPQRRMRRCVVVVDSNMPIDNTKPLVDDFLKLFVSHAFDQVLQYFEKHDLVDSVQGDNTWI